jgi:hypothetical protein
MTKLDHWREQTEEAPRIESPCMSTTTADRILALIKIAEKATTACGVLRHCCGTTPTWKELSEALRQMELTL